MQITLWLADIMTEYIMSNRDKEGVEYKIDLWLWDFVEFCWLSKERLSLRQDFENWSIVANLPLENPEKEEIKNCLLDRIGVYEEDL